MAEDTALHETSFAWAGTGEFTPTDIEDNIENLVGLNARRLIETWPSSNIAPHLAEAKIRLAEEMNRRPMDRIFSYTYYSEIIGRFGTVPIENTVIVLRRGNGDGPLLVGLVRARDTCPVLQQIEGLCRKLDDAGRRLALRLISALAAA